MNINIKTSVILFLAAITVAACSSAPTPTPKNDPYNSSDSQRSRAHQTQDELSSETRKK